MQLFTDASGNEGWGVYWAGRWLHDCWSPKQCDMNNIERAVCHSDSCAHMGHSVAAAKKYSLTVTTKQ